MGPRDSSIDGRITYRLLEARFSKKYGVIACQESSQSFAAAMPFTKDLCRLQEIIQQLNQAQTSIEEFKERYLNGKILEDL